MYGFRSAKRSPPTGDLVMAGGAWHTRRARRHFVCKMTCGVELRQMCSACGQTKPVVLEHPRAPPTHNTRVQGTPQAHGQADRMAYTQRRAWADIVGRQTPCQGFSLRRGSSRPPGAPFPGLHRRGRGPRSGHHSEAPVRPDPLLWPGHRILYITVEEKRAGLRTLRDRDVVEIGKIMYRSPQDDWAACTTAACSAHRWAVLESVAARTIYATA